MSITISCYLYDNNKNTTYIYLLKKVKRFKR